MELDIRDDRIARVTGVPGAQCRIVHLKLGATVLELFEYSQPAGEKYAAQMQQCDRGLIHIGFEVHDFHNVVERFRRAGVPQLGEPVEFRPGVWIGYFRGPDGETCELRDVGQ